MPRILEKAFGRLKKVLREGICWRVGTGSSISIFNDQWITGVTNYRVASSILNSNLTLVSYFIDSSTRTWKEELGNNTFTPEDAKLILRVQLVEVAHPDEMAWSDEPFGAFSIRSSYKLL